MISYQRCSDLAESAKMTYSNMRPFYEHNSVNWDTAKILEQIADLQNWDILWSGKVVGAMRLAFDADGCYLRDLQISEAFQNKGIGAEALLETRRLAFDSGADKLRLRVLKISPAYKPYLRNGFEVVSEDDRFYHMQTALS